MMMNYDVMMMTMMVVQQIHVGFKSMMTMMTMMMMMMMIKMSMNVDE